MSNSNNMGKKYKILLVIRWPTGGIRTFIRYVFRNFDRSKYRFTIIAPAYPDSALDYLLEDLKDYDVSYIKLKLRASIIDIFLLLTKTLVSNRFDLIHSHGFTSGLAAAIPARLSKTKHILTSHDVLLPKQFIGLMGTLRKVGLSLLLPMVDKIHSVGKDAHNNLLEFIPSLKKLKSKCITITNGIEIERFIKAEKKDFRKEMNLANDIFLIGFFGRFMAQKGFKFLIEAIERLVGINDLQKRPLVISFGYGGFIREEKEIISTKGLDAYFKFLPSTSNIGSSIKGLDVVAMPSLWEAYGLLAAETLVSGTPIIGTDCIGLREVLQGTPARIVKSGDSEALASALYEEMKSPSKEKAKEFVEEAAERYDVKKQAKELESLFLELCSKR